MTDAGTTIYVLPGVYQNHLLLFNFVIFLTLAQGVNIIYGFTGYLPFGYVGFFGAGAYGFAIMVMQAHASAPSAVVVAGLVGVALGLLLTPLLRLSGAYFAIANLAASLAVLHLVANPALESITRGPYGVSLTGAFNPTLAYAAALIVLALTLGTVVFLKNSGFVSLGEMRMGHALAQIHFPLKASDMAIFFAGFLGRQDFQGHQLQIATIPR